MPKTTDNIVKIHIETERLIIRNHVKKDWKDLHEYLSLPAIYVFEPGEPIDEKQATEFIEDRMKSTDFLAVELKSESRMVGHLYFHQQEPKAFLTWELGFIFNPAYQARGYCTEASRALIEYAFSEWNAHKITAFCNCKNIASYKVLEKSGMEREGFFKEKAFFRRDADGNPLWHDAYAYGILNPHRTH